jgi:hypothetical protein
MACQYDTAREGAMKISGKGANRLVNGGPNLAARARWRITAAARG